MPDFENGVQLTPRERECLSLVARHMRTKQIARLLGTSPNTVDRQISQACRKLGATGRLDAVQLLLQRGELDPMPENLASGSSGIAEPVISRPHEGATENDPNDQQNHTDLRLERTGSPTERVGGRPGPAGNDPAPGVGDQKAEAIPQRGVVAAGDPVDSGVHSGREVPRGGVFDINRYGYLARLGIIAAIAVVTSLLVTGVLIASDTALESFERLFSN